ncbi:protein RecA (Recombinase A) [Treponema primitia ZAS-2]|uniref:Protein RecA n=1 Tax=Treponema primitia (strain ATCC BAA-887 / DSM 12427 / ZAS-2) TaxID=545694 RepID=F5YHW2_TREPZ|nr:recombinase RecA [Treponema primitia]AEF86566.1 protein RecA (Recombinase A) [Treponema primitia ZAS-2]
MAKNEPEKTRGNPLASTEEKEKALEAARLQIEKQFGSGSLMKLGDHTSAAGIEVIPSGSILLDEALGIGGFPRGRIIEIYGPESSGKTTLALHVVAEAQKMGGIAAFVDAEHALDPVYAKNLGVNTDNLWISQPDTGEQALEITESLVRSGAVDVIVVDSVAALTPQAEIEGDMGDAHMGLQARLMSQALRKLTATIGKSRTILIFINQIRMKIGVMFGNPETTTGGNALKFYASVRLDVRKFETIEGSGDEDALGNRVRVKVVKNKVAPPFRKAELEIIFGKGISAIASLLDAAVKYDIIEKKGAWFSYGEEKVGQGRENAKKYLEENPVFAVEVEQKLRKIMFPGRDFSQMAKIVPPAAEAAPASGLAAAASAVQAGATQAKPPAGITLGTPLETAASGNGGGNSPASGSPVASGQGNAGAAKSAAPAQSAPAVPARGRGRPPLNKAAGETISIGKPSKEDDLF